MPNTGHITVTMRICGDPDNKGRTPSWIMSVTVDSSDGINWEHAADELRAKLEAWAMSFSKYSGTNEITIRPNG